MTEWIAFYQSSASAAATLIGLLVVAISINLARILETPHLPDRAGAAMFPLAGVLIISMLGQVPGQSIRMFGGEVFAVTAPLAAAQVRFLFKSLPQYRGAPKSWLWSRIFLTQGQVLPALIAAVLLLLGLPVGLYWGVAAIIFSLLAAVLNAWVLLVEIVR